MQNSIQFYRCNFGLCYNVLITLIIKRNNSSDFRYTTLRKLFCVHDEVYYNYAFKFVINLASGCFYVYLQDYLCFNFFMNDSQILGNYGN